MNRGPAMKYLLCIEVNEGWIFERGFKRRRILRTLACECLCLFCTEEPLEEDWIVSLSLSPSFFLSFFLSRRRLLLASRKKEERRAFLTHSASFSLASVGRSVGRRVFRGHHIRRGASFPPPQPPPFAFFSVPKKSCQEGKTSQTKEGNRRRQERKERKKERSSKRRDRFAQLIFESNHSLTWIIFVGISYVWDIFSLRYVRTLSFLPYPSLSIFSAYPSIHPSFRGYVPCFQVYTYKYIQPAAVGRTYGWMYVCTAASRSAASIPPSIHAPGKTLRRAHEDACAAATTEDDLGRSTLPKRRPLWRANWPRVAYIHTAHIHILCIYCILYTWTRSAETFISLSSGDTKNVLLSSGNAHTANISYNTAAAVHLCMPCIMYRIKKKRKDKTKSTQSKEGWYWINLVGFRRRKEGWLHEWMLHYATVTEFVNAGDLDRE